MDSFVNAPRKEKDKQKKQRVKLDDMAWYEIVEKLNDSVIADKSPKRPKEVKCFVDSMLVGLGRHLRRCGVDVLIPEDRSDLVRKARSNPMRYIISSGKAYELLRQQFPSRTIGIPHASKMPPLDQLKFVLNKFSVSVNQQDIFSRCMKDGLFMSNMRTSRHLLFLNMHFLKLLKNIIVHDDFDDGVDVLINKVPTQVISRPGQFYYICGDCGKVYWDGSHASNYARSHNLLENMDVIGCKRCHYEYSNSGIRVKNEG
uniref:Mut7-C domain-containing protein n=1 Tax=Heterorhabditis bacteriophora TaxID=37862 RepID=A0A1I7WW28_HETBA